jgi:predicted permease
VGKAMSLAFTSFNQIMIMFFIIIAGAICYKIKLIDKETNKKLADLVLMVVNPFVIFVSYQREFEVKLVNGLLISLVLALITHLFGILIASLLLRKKSHEESIAIERFAVVYSNCGFIGIPLVNGIFGSEGVFYLTAYMTIFNLVVWTHGVITVSGKSDKKSIVKAILSPSVIATVSGFVLFICRILLPNPIYEAINYIGGMNTPMAMMVAGATIAQTDIKKLLIKVRIYYIAFLKLLLVPIAVLCIFNLIEIPRMVLLTVVLAAACPTAATINLFALRFNKDYKYASEMFAITTILCSFTIPLVMIIANFIVG